MISKKQSNILGLGKSERGAEIVGLRFNNINIPQGATITSAKLQFQAHEDSSGAAELSIYGDLSDDAPPFSMVNAATAERIKTTTTPVTWKPGDWTQDSDYSTDDLSSVLQEIVNQTDWCGGQSVAMMIAGTGARAAKSFDQSRGDAPILKFSYDTETASTGSGCINKTLVTSVANTTDDAEERISDGEVDLGSSDLELPYEGGSTNQLIGMRFNNIKIPKDAVITEASLEFEVDKAKNGYLDLKVQGQASDNPATFDDNDYNLSKRPRTAPITWTNVAQDKAQNESIYAYGLAPIAQTLVKRAGWKSGNSMVFFISSVSGNKFREVESYDGERANSPKLRIKYKTSASSAEPTIITAREKLKDVVAAIQWESGTPIVDAYYEAARYYRGEGVDYGSTRGPSSGGNSSLRVSVPESYKDGKVERG